MGCIPFPTSKLKHFLSQSLNVSSLENIIIKIYIKFTSLLKFGAVLRIRTWISSQYGSGSESFYH
jgi:hypothetical protein